MPNNDSDSDFFQSLVDEGVDPELVNRFKDFNNGSPLRHRARTAERKASDLAEQNAKYKNIVLNTTFKDAGIKIDPSVLNIPEDLDITSKDAVSEWATKSGLKENAPAAPSEDFDALEQMEEVISGAETPDSSVITPQHVADWPIDKAMKFQEKHPDAWESLKRGEVVRGIPATQ